MVANVTTVVIDVVFKSIQIIAMMIIFRDVLIDICPTNDSHSVVSFVTCFIAIYYVGMKIKPSLLGKEFVNFNNYFVWNVVVMVL